MAGLIALILTLTGIIGLFTIHWAVGMMALGIFVVLLFE